MMKKDESAFNKLFSSKVYGAIREFQVFKNLLFQRIHSYGQFFFYQYLLHVTSMFRRRSISQTENGHLPITDWLRLWRGGSLYTVMADAGVKNDIRSNMWRTGAWQSLLTFFILSLAWLVGFSSRLFAVIRFESIIHEFDPW